MHPIRPMETSTVPAKVMEDTHWLEADRAAYLALLGTIDDARDVRALEKLADDIEAVMRASEVTLPSATEILISPPWAVLAALP